MSQYGDNVITPDEFINPKHFGFLESQYHVAFVCIGTVLFGFPQPDQVDPNDWTRGTLLFTVPDLEPLEGNWDVGAVVVPATWDLTSSDQPLTPGWGVDWADGAVNPQDGSLEARAGIVSKTGQSELLRCSYQVYVFGR